MGDELDGPLLDPADELDLDQPSGRESGQNGRGDVLWRTRDVDHVGLEVTEVGEPGMQTGERLTIAGITGAPLRGSGQARGEGGPQDDVVEGHTPAHTRL